VTGQLLPGASTLAVLNPRTLFPKYPRGPFPHLLQVFAQISPSPRSLRGPLFLPSQLTLLPENGSTISPLSSASHPSTDHRLTQ
uniref:Uncharacterized protein n=1 Tax=Sus scrofa TaxID=9823 RepID=A0A4X1UYC3_PIG